MNESYSGLIVKWIVIRITVKLNFILNIFYKKDVKISKEWPIPLNLIFNSSMQQEGLTCACLEAHVTPIFKKRNKMLPDNSGPVSLTSVPCSKRLVLRKQPAWICKQKVMYD